MTEEGGYLKKGKSQTEGTRLGFGAKRDPTRFNRNLLFPLYVAVRMVINVVPTRVKKKSSTFT